jgi:hypothetical protein
MASLKVASKPRLQAYHLRYTDELPLAGCGFDRSILWDNFYARVSYGCRDGWVYVIGKDEDSIDGVAYINAAGSSYGDS